MERISLLSVRVTAATLVALVVLMAGSARAVGPARVLGPGPTPSDNYSASLPAVTPNVWWVEIGSNAGFTEQTFSGQPEQFTGSSTTVCDTGAKMAKTAWFRFDGTGGKVQVSSFGSTFDTLLAVYNENFAPKCNDDDEGPKSTSRVTVDTSAGSPYYVQVGGCSGTGCGATTGNLALTVLTNDERANALPLTDDLFTNVGATPNFGNEPVACDSDNRHSPYEATVWFKWKAPAKGRVTIVASGPADTVLTVFRGASTTPDQCNDVAGAELFSSRVALDVGAGEDLALQVGGHSDGTNISIGNFALNTTFQEDLDVDDDHYEKAPGPDCNDNNAAIHPGVTDIPKNGVDENCDGRDNTDGDGDAHGDKALGGDDCNDANAQIFPGASERRGDRVDDDCDGRAQAADMRPAPKITFGHVKVPGGRLFGKLRVAPLPKGAKVAVICHGRGCPRKGRRASKTARRANAVIKFLQFDGRTLRPRAYVEITVTLPGRNTNGTSERYTVRPLLNVRHRTCSVQALTGKKVACRGD
jgi:hypothetical protein